jgi:hypothetical protein
MVASTRLPDITALHLFLHSVCFAMIADSFEMVVAVLGILEEEYLKH